MTPKDDHQSEISAEAKQPAGAGCAGADGSVVCPLCGWESRPPAAESRLSIHILYGHESQEINAAVDDGRLIEDTTRNRFTVPQNH